MRQPKGRYKNADEDKGRRAVADQFMVNRVTSLLRHLRPELALQGLARWLMFAVQVVKNIEVRIVRDLRMLLQEAPEFRIVAVYIFRVRQQRRISGNNLRQRRTHA